MDWVVSMIRENPELAIFLTLAIGFVIGRLRIGSFRLGNVVGTLLAGVLVGQLGIEIQPLVKVVFFDLFLFATGYKVGPQFFRGLRRNALSQTLLTVVLCVASLITTVVAAKVMGYDLGIAAGLLAGAFTESTVIGTAGNAISNLSYDPTWFHIIYGGTSDITISGGTASSAMVYAANSAVTLAGGSDFYGSVVGSEIKDTGGTHYHYDRRLQNDFMVAGNFMMSAFTWRKY